MKNTALLENFTDRNENVKSFNEFLELTCRCFCSHCALKVNYLIIFFLLILFRQQTEGYSRLRGNSISSQSSLVTFICFATVAACILTLPFPIAYRSCLFSPPCELTFELCLYTDRNKILYFLVCKVVS